MGGLPFQQHSTDRTRDLARSVLQPAPKSRKTVKVRPGANLRPRYRRAIYLPARTDSANGAIVAAQEMPLIGSPPSRQFRWSRFLFSILQRPNSPEHRWSSQFSGGL